jgi:amidohydrolase
LDTHSFKKQAMDLQDEMISWRRDFHQHPELGFQEKRTSGIIAQRMTEWGYKVQEGIAETGVIAQLVGKAQGPTVLLRFDMDALPIQEQNKTSYVSIHPGVMHACGHDGHMAIGLAVGRMLSFHRNQISGSVKFVFQPAEETLGGALRMVREGVLENPKPDICLAAHLWNEKPLGWMGISTGPLMAGADILQITVRGKGGHGAIPNQTHDPVLASAYLITALQSIVARNVDPRKSGVLSITQVLAGDAYNVIPAEAVLRGTIRTFESDVRQLILGRIEKLSGDIATAFNCEAEVKIDKVAPPVVNDEGVSTIARSIAQELFPEAMIANDVMSMVSEDMAYMMEQIPGCYILIGSSDPERGLDAPHHNPLFDFNEEVLPLGAAIMAATAWEILEAR